MRSLTDDKKAKGKTSTVLLTVRILFQVHEVLPVAIEYPRSLLRMQRLLR